MSEAQHRIQVTEGDAWVEIRFHHPKSNAMSADLLAELTSLVAEHGNREGVSVIHFRSEGEVFCAGASFDELLQVKDQEQGELFFMGFAKLILAIVEAKAIVLTSVQGKAIGGAVGLVAASDYVLCSKEAKLRLSELAIGIGPFVISPVIKQKVGVAGFMNMALSPKKWFSVQWMEEHNMANQVVEHLDLEIQAEVKRDELASYSSQALQAIKQHGFDRSGLGLEMKSMARVSGGLVQSEHTKEILKTFLSR